MVTQHAGLHQETRGLEPLPFTVWDRFHLADGLVSPVLQTRCAGTRCGGGPLPDGTTGRAALVALTGFLISDAGTSLVSTDHFFAGLDAGGSKTLLLAECGGCSGRINRRGPAANPQRGGVEEAARTLARLVQDGMQDHRPVAHLSVCAGVAGAGRMDDQDSLADHMKRALRTDATSVQVQVVHDAHIALDAAFGSESGLVVIAGTGSVVCGRARDGTTRRVGGWGYRLGDSGSGYAVGRAGLRAVAEAFDGGVDTSLRVRVREQYDIDSQEALIHRVYQDDFPLQTVAPLVIEAAVEGDPVAADILSSQAEQLTQQVEWLLEGTDDFAPRIALLGGMLQSEHYAQVLRQALRDRVPDWSVEVLRDKPALGALRRARRQAETPHKE